MFSSSKTRVRKRCILTECPNRPSDNGLCERHNQEHSSVEQQFFKSEIQSKSTNNKGNGKQMSKKMKKQNTTTLSSSSTHSLTSLPKKTNNSKFKPIQGDTRIFVKCMFYDCIFRTNHKNRCHIHINSKKCMFPGCYHIQKDNYRCQNHSNFKLCRRKYCNIFGIDKFCKKHT
jgi:hypothetical protein